MGHFIECSKIAQYSHKKKSNQMHIVISITPTNECPPEKDAAFVFRGQCPLPQS